MMKSYKIGKQVICCKRWINYRRVGIFVFRSWWHKKEVTELENFFEKTPFRQSVIERNPELYVQLLRQVLYRGATTVERLDIIKQHFSIMEDLLSVESIEKLYIEEAVIQLWREQLRDHEYAINLLFRKTEIREGLLTLNFTRENKSVYHINFSFVKNTSGEAGLLIGAIQGQLGAGTLYKDMTKAFFGYRPKNFILHALRILSQSLDLKEMRAVSNYGFQANNHCLRRNRKLKTSLDDFWLQVDGELLKDRRFFKLPILELRKTMEEISTHKRNLYRKRFAVLDKMEEDVRARLRSALL
jgi:uncharacterized protein VirK/YbjX